MNKTLPQDTCRPWQLPGMRHGYQASTSIWYFAVDNVTTIRGGSMALDLSLIHISEPTRLRRISYAVFCLKKKKKKNKNRKLKIHRKKKKEKTNHKIRK